MLLGNAFEQVYALDPSMEQIANAEPHPRVSYIAAPAERTGLDPGCVDLIVAAQAVHWFDQAAFWQEVNRIAAPPAVCALVAYGLANIEPAVDERIRRFHDVGLAAYWPPERMSVMNGYRDISFPYPDLEVPSTEMTCRWTLAQLLAYVDTWSGVKAAQRAGHGGLLTALQADLRRLWAHDDQARLVR